MTVTEMIIIAQNDRYPSRKWPLFDNTTKMTVMHQIRKITVIFRGGNAEKRTFDWVIAPLKYGCVLVEWILSFNKNISNFISDTRWRYFWYFKLFFSCFLAVNISPQSAHNDFIGLKWSPWVVLGLVKILSLATSSKKCSGSSKWLLDIENHQNSFK